MSKREPSESIDELITDAGEQPTVEETATEEEQAGEAPEAAEPEAPRGPVGEPELVEIAELAPLQETDTRPAAPEGHKLLVYRGLADIFEHGEYKFRPDGKPVAVPSAVAEDLLTWPNEQFVALED